MSLLILEWYTRDFIRNNPEAYFVFGDNFDRIGTGGQAKVCRGEPNTIGIATKKTPSHNSYAYLTDNDLNTFKLEVDEKFYLIRKLLDQGKTVYWPQDGIGTGLAKLKEKSPKCWNYLEQKTNELFRDYKEF